MVNIVVCIKAVSSRIINADAKNMPSYILNPYDQFSLNEIIALKKKIDCKITCICMGRNELDEMLYRCKAMGVDDVVLLSDKAFTGSDTYATTYTLAAALKKIPFDIIVCGAEAIDGETGQVPIGLARRLDLFCITNVEKIVDLNETVTLVCAEDKKKITLQSKLPVLITFNNCSTKSEPINLLALRKARKTSVTVWNAESLEVAFDKLGQVGSKTMVQGSLGTNYEKKNAIKMEQDDEQFLNWFEKMVQL
jgi:electron transfer flavoprotein beta subunit